MSYAPVILWFRQDLRLADHPALNAAAAHGAPLLPVYILDEAAAGEFAPGGASRWWLHHSLEALDASLRRHGGRLILRRGDSESILNALLQETGAAAVYATRGYAPWQKRLEQKVGASIARSGAQLRLAGGHLLFEPGEIRTKDGRPYQVFTPFWKMALAEGVQPDLFAAPKRLRLAEANSDRLQDWGLLPRKPDWAGGLREHWQPGEAGAAKRLETFIGAHLAGYVEDRSRLDLEATSQLSPHLHLGEIAVGRIWHEVEQAAKQAKTRQSGADAFLRELGWRDFSYHLLDAFPETVTEPLKPEFAGFPWRRSDDDLKAWQEGRTGYPIVDAAMRQLWQEGWMPNRARMIVASFLVKHLLIPWQQGASWFWDTLVDADIANNTASWQWVAGSGADAAPYFRIFNPVLQAQKFDPSGDYVRRFVPELAQLGAADIHSPWDAAAARLEAAGVSLGETYPLPLVDHAEGRKRALAAFEEIRR